MSRARIARLCACVLVLVIAAGAVASVRVSAATTLQWLVSGVKLTEALAAEVVGELTLGVLHIDGGGVNAAILCSGGAVGTDGPGPEGQITAILNLARETISLEKPLLCASLEFCEGSENEVSVEDLPWLTHLELMGTEAEPLFLDVIEGGGKGNPILDIGCKTFLGNIIETCTIAKVGTNLVNDASESDALGAFEKETVATCNNGGSAYVEDGSADGPSLLTSSGGALSVSYE